MEREKDVEKVNYEEIKMIKLLLVHDAKLDSLANRLNAFEQKLDWYKLQLQEKDTFIRKLMYLIISILGALAGAGGFIKAILGV